MRNTKLFGYLKRKYNRWVWKNLPPCREIVPVISQSRDRRLTWREKIVVKSHLAACNPCVRYLAANHFLGAVFHNGDGKILPAEPTAGLSRDARERIKNTWKSSAVLLSLLLYF